MKPCIMDKVSYPFHGVTMNREMNIGQVQLGRLRLSKSEQRTIQSTLKQFEQARRRRVNNLMNAIAELQTGDLEAVIDLDTVAPMEEDGPSRLDPNEARNGRELAEILEDRLLTLLAVGEWGLCTGQRPREKRRRYAELPVEARTAVFLNKPFTREQLKEAV
jgi:hypothetical protein